MDYIEKANNKLAAYRAAGIQCTDLQTEKDSAFFFFEKDNIKKKYIFSANTIVIEDVEKIITQPSEQKEEKQETISPKKKTRKTKE